MCWSRSKAPLDVPELTLPEANRAGDERTTLTETLDYFRVVLLRKANGLSDDQLGQRVHPSNLTIGGLLMHMALVEDWWFDHRFLGNDERQPWVEFPWEDDPDWELNNAHLTPGDQQRQLFLGAITRSRQTVEMTRSLDQLSSRCREADGNAWNLRWIVVHMIEEYARHCGHADFLRQAIDGATGD